MMSKTERIAELKEELKNVKGEECEVYSRVVGYHSPTSHWNNGKKEEFQQREVFQVSK